MSKYALGNLLELKRGQDLTKNDMCKGTYPVVGSNGIIGMHNVFNVKAPCITVGRSGTVGAVHYYNENCWAHNTCLYVSDFKNNNPLYLYYLLKNIDLTKVATSTGVPTLNRNFVYPITTTATANLDEQNNIANILGAIDEKIENNDAISAQLEALAKTIYDYWFLQFEFPNEEGKPYKSSGGKMVWNEELKREIPEGWEVNELCKVFDITMGSSPKGESLNENHEGIEFYQGSTDFGDLYPVQRVYTTAPVRLAKAQDILISVRAPVGDMNIAMNDCCIGRGLAAVHYRSSLYTWNTLLTLKPYFDIFNGTGTTFGALTSDGLKQQHIVKPSNIIIEKYISRISKIELKLRTITIENQQLTSLRDFLLPLLMNGQVTFKDEVASEEG